MKRPYADVTYLDDTGVTVFRAVSSYLGEGDPAERMAAQIRESTDGERPGFVHAFVLNWECRLEMLERVRDLLAPHGFVCVRPDELDRLYREWLAGTSDDH
jgi:hypothetical protein